MNKALSEYLTKALGESVLIDTRRKNELENVTRILKELLNTNKELNIVFICTHNSRRSHIADLFANAFAAYFGINNVYSYSAGTEATAFNIRAVKALASCGFDIEMTKNGDNPLYEVKIDNDKQFTAFSKAYTDFSIPEKFAAVMVCSHAEVNCPYIPNALKRISLNYDDPKDFDGTEHESLKYSERCSQIAREIGYIFSKF